MRVFVTGVTGFIGGSIATRLVHEGHRVAGLTRSLDRVDRLAELGIEPVVGTLDEVDVVAGAAGAADAVINAADSDHRGVVHTLIDALAGTGKPLLHTSGTSIVGDDARGHASNAVFTEADVRPGGQWRPTSDKAARVAIDRLAIAAADRNVRSVVLCNSLIYGHGRGIGRDSVQLPRLVAHARRSGAARYLGPGENRWSTVHIDDAVDLYLRALDSAPAGSFYFVENGEASFGEMAGAIADVMGLGEAQSWDVEAAIAEWGYEVAVYALGSNSRVRGEAARNELSWTPRYDSVLHWIRTEMNAAE
ncbi:NAD-dependent epimerase/dehydratase family protein [Nocardia sp. CC227C]|uniref:NAD-dependent epimerase/dehydratase family protein n=1 Tax=Nocardia sp. CC227C TaxID=3044562 RepID=UPI00278BE333|nr:NAD-dependent epimerase/dehydratase family protein [Nocardia sp. CC227C]